MGTRCHVQGDVKAVSSGCDRKSRRSPTDTQRNVGAVEANLSTNLVPAQEDWVDDEDICTWQMPDGRTISISIRAALEYAADHQIRISLYDTTIKQDIHAFATVVNPGQNYTKHVRNFQELVVLWTDMRADPWKYLVLGAI